MDIRTALTHLHDALARVSVHVNTDCFKDNLIVRTPTIHYNARSAASQPGMVELATFPVIDGDVEWDQETIALLAPDDLAGHVVNQIDETSRPGFADAQVREAGGDLAARLTGRAIYRG